MTVTHAQIEPTTRCNFTCGFCAGRHMRQRDLDWAAFVAFLDAHPALARVELQGEGEPLLHKRFFDMVDTCRARRIAVALITNGSLLDEAAAARLVAGGVDSIHVSLESADPAVFRAIRGGRFGKVRDGLARLVAARRAAGRARPVVGLAVTALRGTLGSFDAILDLYAGLGLDGGIVLQPLQGMAAYSRHYPDATRAELIPAALMPRFTQLRGQAARAAPVREPRDFFYFDLFAGFDPRTRGCPWLERGAYLAASGAITGCCFMKEESEAFAPAQRAARAATARAALSRTLDRGEVPGACAGCGTAAAIARARAPSIGPAR